MKTAPGQEEIAIREALAKGPTSGAWTHTINRSGHSFIVQDVEKRLVCSMSWHHSSREYYPLKDESEANAALLAACNPANITALLAHLSDLRAEVERLSRDARRYQWLRDPANEINVEVPTSHGHGYDLPGYAEELDEAIDAEMAATEKGGRDV